MKIAPDKRMKWATQADLSSLPELKRDSARRVLLALAYHANQETLICRIAHETLAEFAAISSTTVKRAIKLLEEAMLVSVRRSRRWKSMYMIIIGDMGEGEFARMVEMFKTGSSLNEMGEALTVSMVTYITE